ncbi:MAG: hydrogen peroxide-inducible genes activator [Aestuariivirga sp.]|uniref:hydrogen peroxide-inducible genes activator n=1 Tax=Aestuariivirga sp. TaxID=2650926 RepID=UPI0025C2BC10|nr:hydrogen peroxide-inducible genes activator [Aestuariivirga sp.]MCA3561112.1 hydrogen peroxide-inducible genes activator [Aestuariivirga sp.]
MNNLTLRQLRYFEALAQHGHFGRAAEACAVSQPALSLQIRELELSLGTDLFERSPRQVRLTRFGEDFAPRVRGILRAVDELGDLARASKGWFAGRLRIGVIPTVAPYLLPGLVGSLNRLLPGLDIHVRETLTARLLRELSEGRLDAAIVALPVSEPSLSEAPLFVEEFLFVRPPEQASEPLPSADMLKDMRLLLLEEGHCFREQALAFCNIAPAQPREMLEASSLSTLVQMVAAGIGVTFIPEMAAPVETRSAAVALSRFAEPRPRRTIGMIWRRSSPLAGQLHHIAGIVRQTAEALRAAPSPAQPA